MTGPVYTKNGYGVFKLDDGMFAIGYKEKGSERYDMIVDDCKTKLSAIELINDDLNK